MSRVYYRTVKDNRIRLLGKTLGCEALSGGQLDGKRFAFIPYAHCPDGLTSLWGTEEMSRLLCTLGEGDEDRVHSLWNEDLKILAPDGYIRWGFWKEVV